MKRFQIKIPKIPKITGFPKSGIEASRKFRNVFKTIKHHYAIARSKQLADGTIPTNELNPIMCEWAKDLLHSIDFKLHVKGEKVNTSRSQIFVGNHLSYIDIPLLLASAPVVFVAKHEVQRWPVIGKAAKIAGAVFVKRNSIKSRKRTLDAIDKCLTERRQSVCIFPAGTTSIGETKPWRYGAFEMAKRLKVPVQPFRLTYKPLRKCAYIDKDMFFSHLWMLLNEKHIDIFIEFGKPVMIEDVKADSQRIWQWTQEIFEQGH